MIISRKMFSVLKDTLSTRRVILLYGARQCGKTTLTKQLNQEDIIYRTLDDQGLLKAAKLDPEGFTHGEGKTMVIDEIQRVPELLLSIKKIVDQDNRKGQFLLTGSANINSLPTVKESLAGRIGYVRLRTLTQGEIEEASGNFLQNAFQQSFRSSPFKEKKADIIEYCFRGGYPEALNLSPRSRTRYHGDYIRSIIERDLQDIQNVHRIDLLHDLFKILCAWSGKFLDFSKLSSHFQANRATIYSYINLLEIMFLCERVPSWIKTDYQRIGKRPKFFMSDVGLICSILKWKVEEVVFDSDRSGKIFESFVFQELSALIDHADGEFSLYHYRDRENREIDFLIENENGTLLGIEVKAGSNVGENDFKHLHWFKNHINPNFIGIVLYTGEHVLPMGKGFWAIPIGHLWA